MISVLRVETRWSGRICGLDLYSQEKLQLRKGRFGETDSIGDVDGKKIRPVSWEGRRRLTGGSTLSVTQVRDQRGGVRAGLAAGFSPRRTQIGRSSVGEGGGAGAGRSRPKRGTAHAWRRWAAVKKLGFRAESEEKGKFLFLFSFQILQSIFK
jgi:hypothetical protein